MRIHSIAVLSLSVALTGCGPSEQEIESIAIITCITMENTLRTSNGDPVKILNDVRQEIGEEPYLGDITGINSALEYQICEELVLNDPNYEQTISVIETLIGAKCPELETPTGIVIPWLKNKRIITEIVVQHIQCRRAVIDEYVVNESRGDLERMTIELIEEIERIQSESQTEEESIYEKYRAESERLSA